jgi:hypothetical protein
VQDWNKKILVSVKKETLNGKPHGFCWVKYINNRDTNKKNYKDGDPLTFKGFCYFENGIIHGGPAFFISGNGYTLSFSKFWLERPADGCILRSYYPTSNDFKFMNQSAKGSPRFIGQVNRDRLEEGKGRLFY